MIAITCPGCKQQLQVNEEGAGLTVSCPGCGRALAAPTPATTSATAAIESPTLIPQGFPGGTTEAEGTVARNPRATERTLSHADPSGTVGESTAAVYPFLAPAQAPGELGRLGPYHVVKVLGAGGMGVVFQAHDPHLERSVALKAMLPSLAANPSAKQRFLREARAVAAIKHDHIVTIYQVAEDRGTPFLAMELLEGESLDDRLMREGNLPLQEVLRIGREMAEGLAAAHKRGLIHRDIKPGNVWLEGDRSRVKILDFGLVGAAADSAELTQPGVGAGKTPFTDNAQLTQAGAILGTPAFMAPEQADGKPVDARCDLFSLGCVLYQMATGKLPFLGRNMLSTLMAVSVGDARPPQELNSDLPPDVCELVMQLLAKKPEDRPPSAQAAVEAIRAIEHDLAVRPSVRAAARSWLRRHRVLAAGIVALAVALVCVLLHFLNQLLHFDKMVATYYTILRQNWLPILFLLTLTETFLAYCVYRCVVGLAPRLFRGRVAVVILLALLGLVVTGPSVFFLLLRR